MMQTSDLIALRRRRWREMTSTQQMKIVQRVLLKFQDYAIRRRHEVRRTAMKQQAPPKRQKEK